MAIQTALFAECYFEKIQIKNSEFAFGSDQHMIPVYKLKGKPTVSICEDAFTLPYPSKGANIAKEHTALVEFYTGKKVFGVMIDAFTEKSDGSHEFRNCSGESSQFVMTISKTAKPTGNDVTVVQHCMFGEPNN